VFCLTLAWASLGQVDIIALAQGKIVPSGRTKTVQPFETGIIRAIHVRDGQRVRAGEVLIELDPTISGAELRRLQGDPAAAELDLARLRATLTDGDPMAAFRPPAEASDALVATQRQLLVDQTSEQRAKLAALDQQHAVREAEIDTYKATIAKLDATILLLRQRFEIRKYLAEREIGSKIFYLENLTELVQQ
jgi:hemolysin D